jgi:hypothetical protein
MRERFIGDKLMELQHVQIFEGAWRHAMMGRGFNTKVCMVGLAQACFFS